jgi:hypothetical protein
MGDSTPELANVPPIVCRTIERSLTRRGLDADRVLSAFLHFRLSETAKGPVGGGDASAVGMMVAVALE